MKPTNSSRPIQARSAPQPALAARTPGRVAPQPTARAATKAAAPAPRPLTRPAPAPTIPKSVTDKVLANERTTAGVPKDRADNGVAQAPKRKLAAAPAPVVEEAEEFEDAPEANGASEFSEEELAEAESTEVVADTEEQFEEPEAEVPAADPDEFDEPAAAPAPAKKQPARTPAPLPKPAPARQPVPQHAPPATRPRKPEPRVGAGHEVTARSNQEVGASRRQATQVAVRSDILVPKILLVQASSKMAKERKAFAGQIVRSPSGDVLGGIMDVGKESTPIDIIPLSLSQSWTIVEADQNKFRRVEPRTPENDGLHWEFEDDDGVPCKRLRTVDLIALLQSDLDQGSVEVDEDEVPLNLNEASVLPYAISFKSTGLQAGKFITTTFALIENAQKQYPNTRPYHYGLSLNASADSDGEHDYFVLEASNTHKITNKAHVAVAKNWYDQIHAGVNLVIEDEGQAEELAAENMVARPKGVARPPRGQY